MKHLLLYGLVFLFLFAPFYSLTAQNNSPSVVAINGKKFLSLNQEPSPDKMIWGNFGSPVESYYGIVAYSNGARKSGRKYQCTELIHRFLTEIYGIPSSINLGLGHGKDLAKNVAEHYKAVVGTSDTLQGYSVRLENFENEKSIYPPVTGSIVSMYFNSQKKGYGHVGIIREIKVNEEGLVEATLFDQHGFAHKEAGIPIQADRLLFEKDANGNWSGSVLSWKYDRKYPVISWTNPVIVEDESTSLLEAK
jgi:hypothetical protein